MHISNNMIRKEIRVKGMLFRCLLPFFTKKKFKVINKIMVLMKHKNFSKSLKMDEIYIKRPDNTKLRVVIYRSKSNGYSVSSKMPGVLWIHGGGYGIGVPEQDFMFAEILEERQNCVIFMPDYCLATQAPYPAALDDCYLALKYMKEHASKYNINIDQIFTGGDSAGGGLCTALNLKARDLKEVDIAFTMPLYPMLDARETTSSKNNDAPVWNTKSNKAGWDIYLNNQEMTKYSVPALEDDFSEFPPTITYIGTIEPFYDETKDFVKKLRACGVKVAYKEYKGCFHAFDILCGNTKVGQDARKYLGDHFEYACKHFTSSTLLK